jgi:hypothetical protein
MPLLCVMSMKLLGELIGNTSLCRTFGKSKILYKQFVINTFIKWEEGLHLDHFVQARCQVQVSVGHSLITDTDDLK